MSTVEHVTTAQLRCEIHKLRIDLADLRCKLAATEDRLCEATGLVAHWRGLYHGVLQLPDTEVEE